MGQYKRIFLVSLIVAVASQISIGLIVSDFVVSAGIIFLVALFFYYTDLPPVKTSFTSGMMVYLLRVIVYFLATGSLNNALISYSYEIIFYILYSLIFSLIVPKNKRDNLNFVLLALIITDFSANFIEVFIRSLVENSPRSLEITYTLLLVSLVRSAVIWLVLNGLKYYRLLLIKEEHEERYRKLLWLISKLKSEMYWLEKNMENIELVMNESYKLYERIYNNQERDSWANSALTIAKEVHEIKKENGLAIRGIRAATEKELKDEGIDYKDIVNILFESMKREISQLGKNIVITFNVGCNFYTEKHYYLMSLLRNLIMNSIDAISDEKNGKIVVENFLEDDIHHFIVRDNGIGIVEDKIKHIFSPGFSTKINYKTGEINRGLGLSIVKHIVEDELNGRMEISSTLNKGTRFNIYIPKEILEE